MPSNAREVLFDHEFPLWLRSLNHPPMAAVGTDGSFFRALTLFSNCRSLVREKDVHVEFMTDIVRKTRR